MDDMDDDDDKPAMLTIDELPLDAQFEILKWIVEERDLDSVQLVCPLWYAIIDEWVGRYVSTYTRMVVPPWNKDGNNNNNNSSKGGLDLLPEIGIRKLVIGIRNGNLLEHPPSPLPSYRYPHLLKDFVLLGKIHPDLFTNLVEGTINLSILDVSLLALISLKTETLEHLNLPGLARLRVESFELQGEALSLPNVRALLRQNRFRRLVHLQVDFHVEMFQDLETIRLLFPFIRRHPALKELAVSMIFVADFTPLEEGSTYQEDFDNIIKILGGDGWCRSLQKLKVMGRGMSGNYHPHFELWKEFLLKPSSLQELTLRIGPLSNELLNRTCSRNGASLRELTINQFPELNVPHQGQLDLSVFSQLKVVRSLELLGSVEVIGARHLPPILEYILLTGRMRSEESAQILLNFPNLNKIVLVDFRNGQEGYGVRMEDLRQFVEQRRVDSLVLDILDDHFPEERIPNGDLANPIQLTVSHGTYLHWKLSGPEGYYVNGDRII